MKIRRGNKKDVSDLVEITKNEKSIEDFPGEYDKKMFGDMLKKTSDRFLVAVIDGKVVGFVVSYYNKKGKRLYIDSLGVHKSYRGKGIGNRLVEDAEIRGKREGARISYMFVRVWNKSMNSLAKSKKYKIKERFNRWERKLK